MENNLSEEFLNIPVREPNLLNGFFSDNPKADVEIVKLFISDEVLGEILIIKGEPGNGKRHLLQGAANELLKNDIKIVFPSPSPPSLFTIFKNDKDSFEKSLQNCSFCLIDYLAVHAGVQSKKRVLEVACGSGLHSLFLAKTML